MIELPHEFLNAIFAAVIIVANVRRGYVGVPMRNSGADARRYIYPYRPRLA